MSALLRGIKFHTFTSYALPFQTTPLPSFITRQLHIASYCLGSSTSTAISPTSTPDLVGQHKTEGDTFRYSAEDCVLAASCKILLRGQIWLLASYYFIFLLHSSASWKEIKVAIQTITQNETMKCTSQLNMLYILIVIQSRCKANIPFTKQFSYSVRFLSTVCPFPSSYSVHAVNKGSRNVQDFSSLIKLNININILC